MKILQKYAGFKKVGPFLSRHRLAIYPTVVLVLFIILVCFKVNGSSIGIYHDYFYGNTSKDPNLLFGKPRAIRSDEWLVTTQVTIAQEKNNYDRVNNNLLGGQDLSVLLDAPYKEWSSIFRPQNFSFYVLPFEYAFAFKWWLLLIGLLLSSYAFSLRILGKDKIPLSILLSIVFSFSPFIFWWYQSITILPLIYGLLLILVGMSIIDKTPLSTNWLALGERSSSVVKSGIMSYLLVSFALVFYPPFQIPVALCVAFFLLGYLFQKGFNRSDWLAIILPVVFSIVTALAIIGVFALTRMDTIKAITGTVYPGHRVVASGGYDATRFAVTYLQPLLQSNSRGGNYISNQSESSIPLLTPFYFLVPFLSLFVWSYVRSRKIDWVLFCLILCNLLFLANLFIPNIDVLSKITFLYLVPHDRLLIGIGFITMISLIYSVKIYSDKDLAITPRVQRWIIAYVLVIFATAIALGLKTQQLHPLFITSKLHIIALSIALFCGIVFILFKKFTIGLTALALFSLVSTLYIHPIYVGLGPVYNGRVTESLQSTSDKHTTWAVADNIAFEHFPQISGRSAITGVSAYPNLLFWKQFSNDEKTYNRYAHITLSDNTGVIELEGNDSFTVSEDCNNSINRKIDYVLSASPLKHQCYSLVKVLKYPSITFYIYKHVK